MMSSFIYAHTPASPFNPGTPAFLRDQSVGAYDEASDENTELGRFIGSVHVDPNARTLSDMNEIERNGSSDASNENSIARFTRSQTRTVASACNPSSHVNLQNAAASGDRQGSQNDRASSYASIFTNPQISARGLNHDNAPSMDVSAFRDNMPPPPPAYGTLSVSLDNSDPMLDIIFKLQPSFLGEIIKAVFAGHFKRVIGHKDYQMLYVIVHPDGRKVKSLFDNIFIVRDDKNKCWWICNGFGTIFRSHDKFQIQLHQQSHFSIPSGARHFALNFDQCSPEPAASCLEVPQTIQLCFMTFTDKQFKWTGSYALSPPSEARGSNGQSMLVQQYDRVKTNYAPAKNGVVDDYCLGIEVDAKIQPFTVTMREGKTYFTDVVGHWVVCSLAGTIYAKSLDVASSPLDVLWWNVFEGPKLVCSTMDICASVPGAVWAHDIRFTNSDNIYLNGTFRSKGSSNPACGLIFNAYEMADTNSTSLLQLNFCLKLQKWLITSMDQACLPLQWNLVAMSNASATYTNPTLCKEWFVLDVSGTYKPSLHMTCEMTPRRIVCASVDVPM